MTRSTMRPAALAALLALAGTAGAQEIQLHGLLDLGAGRFQPSGESRVWRVDSGAMSTSFLGLSGTDDLGGGVRALFALEHFLRADTGSTGRFDGQAFWGRSAYVGIGGAFGTTVLGRHVTPLFVAAARFNAFGESFAFSPSVRHLFAPRLLPFFGDTRWDNAVHFTSPDDDGLRFSLMANLGEAAAGATGKNLGGNVFYERGPLHATIALQRVRNGEGLSTPSDVAPPGFKDQHTWLLGLSYEVSALMLYGQYSQVHTEAATSARTRLWSLGAALPLGPVRLLAEYGSATAQLGSGAEPRHRTFALGADYRLSTRTDLYAAWVSDKVGGLATGNTLAGGMRLRF